jgi:uncharacterized protein
MQQPSRVELIDSLRGFALMGLFLIHCVELFELYWAHPEPGPVFDWVFGLFAGKSYALFALTFGLSFFIIMDSASKRGVDFTGRFIWRLTLLFLIGLIHGLVYRGDILVTLALLGLTLPLFNRIASKRILLFIALLFFLQIPLILRAWAASRGADWANQAPLFLGDTGMSALTDGNLIDTLKVNAVGGQVGKWSYYLETGRVTQIMGLFLVGLVLGRIGFFADPNRFTKQRRIMLAVSTLVWALLFFNRPGLADAFAPAGGVPAVRQNVDWLLDAWSALALLTVQVLLLVEIYQSAARPIIASLSPIGRMTLTLYVGQSLVFVPIFYGFGLGLHDDISSVQAITLGIVTFVLQMALAHWWFRHFLYGPLEWAWRAATRTSTNIPFVRREPSAAN